MSAAYSEAEKALIKKLREAVKYVDENNPEDHTHKLNEACMVEMAGNQIMTNAYKWCEE